MRVRLALARGDTARAQDALAQFHAAPPVDAFAPVEGWLLAAVLASIDRDERAALAALELALDGAEPEGYRMPFLDGSAPVRTLLEQALRRGTRHRALVGELLSTIRHGAPPTTTVRELLEPLSDREEAVLRFLPTELSNGEIASEMFVSVNTVKTHLRSIYRKLDVRRRHEAVERARELRLLAPGGIG
jgi:LuxR family maltose regulon positive regulatory protein